jgi:hypothetical protein
VTPITAIVKLVKALEITELIKLSPRQSQTVCKTSGYINENI